MRLTFRAAEQQAEEVARRLDLRERVLVDGNAEPVLDSQPQLEPAQAVEAEIALEQAVEARGDDRRAGAARLGEKGVEDVEQLARDVVWRRSEARVGGESHAAR